MTYLDALIAAGEHPEQALFLVQRNELERLENRSHGAYGKRYDPNPPSAEDVRAAYEFKLYGVERDAD